MLSQIQNERVDGTIKVPLFGQTVKPISTRRADYAHHSTTSLSCETQTSPKLELGKSGYQPHVIYCIVH